MKIFGAPPPVGFLARRGWRNGSGYNSTWVFEGDRNSVAAQESIVASQRAGAGILEYQAVYDTTPCSLRVEFGSSMDGTQPENLLETVWSITTTRENVSVWEHSGVKEYMANLQSLGAEAALVQFQANVEDAIKTGTMNEQLTAVVASNADIAQLVAHLAAKQDTFIRDRWNLRCTQTWPVTARFTPDYANVNKQMTSVQIEALAAREGGFLLFALPTNRWWTIGGLDIQNVGSQRLQQVRMWEEMDHDTWFYGNIS